MTEVNKLAALVAEAKKRQKIGDRRDILVHDDDVLQIATEYKQRTGQASAHIPIESIVADMRAGNMKILGLLIHVHNRPKPPPPAFAPRAVKRKL